MGLIIGIIAVVVALYIIGTIMGLLRISKGILGTIFNILLMLFRKIWPIFVVLVIIAFLGGSLGWF